MRLYDLFTKHIKKNLYIVYHERFKSETSEIHIERYLAKHILLKPELIIINDQLHGFKKTKDALKGLEKFPVFLEVEYIESDDGERYIENIDLYAEADVPLTNKLSTLKPLIDLYDKHVVIERVTQISEQNLESMVFYSKINDFLGDQFLEEDLQDGMTSAAEVEDVISQYIINFVNFLKLLDDAIHRKKPLSDLKKLSSLPLVE